LEVSPAEARKSFNDATRCKNLLHTVDISSSLPIHLILHKEGISFQLSNYSDYLGGDMMTKGKDAKKEPKKQPVPSSVTSQGSTIKMLNQKPSKKKNEYK
jgi:hypothetical protein